VIKLGNDPANGQVFQAVVPAGCWFASESSGEFSFVGCTVSPGFDFQDFELAKADQLSKKYPQHADIIQRLCR
jgi:predicted cupin superfamily sugar epimerase